MAERAMLLSLALVMTWSASTQAQTPIQADEVMAAFVYRFPQFVEWPGAALEGSDAIEICIAEPDALSRSLQRLVEGEELHGRPLVVRHISRSRSLDGCHVLYLSQATDRQDVLLHEAGDRPILTVGDAPDFLDSGGIIRLVVIDRRIRFEVNSDAAARAGLRLSSQLLDLAVAVHGVPSS